MKTSFLKKIGIFFTVLGFLITLSTSQVFAQTTTGTSGTVTGSSGTPTGTSGTPTGTSGTPTGNSGTRTTTVQPIASLPNPLGDKVKSIPDLFYLLVNALISVSYVVIAFFLIVSGFKFVTAQGSEDKITDAKNTFKYTIIGALIIIGAQVIIDIVKSIISGLGITG